MARPTKVEASKRDAQKETHTKVVPQPKCDTREMSDRMRTMKRKEMGR